MLSWRQPSYQVNVWNRRCLLLLPFYTLIHHCLNDTNGGSRHSLDSFNHSFHFILFVCRVIQRIESAMFVMDTTNTNQCPKWRIKLKVMDISFPPRYFSISDYDFPNFTFKLFAFFYYRHHQWSYSCIPKPAFFQVRISLSFVPFFYIISTRHDLILSIDRLYMIRRCCHHRIHHYHHHVYWPIVSFQTVPNREFLLWSILSKSFNVYDGGGGQSSNDNNSFNC